MTKIKTVLAASSALMIMAAAPAFAQSSYGSGTKASTAKTEMMKEKAKDEAMKKAKAEGKEMVEDAMMKEGKSYGSGDKAKDAMMDKGDAMMKHKAKSYGSGDKAKDVMMDKGESMMKDEAKSYGSGKAKDAMMDKGDAMMKKDGMIEDAAMKDHSMKGDHMMKDKMMRPGQVQTQVAPLPLNCPAGTKGQADGTCMIVDSRLYPS